MRTIARTGLLCCPTCLAAARQLAGRSRLCDNCTHLHHLRGLCICSSSCAVFHAPAIISVSRCGHNAQPCRPPINHNGSLTFDSLCILTCLLMRTSIEVFLLVLHLTPEPLAIRRHLLKESGNNNLRMSLTIKIPNICPKCNRTIASSIALRVQERGRGSKAGTGQGRQEPSPQPSLLSRLSSILVLSGLLRILSPCPRRTAISPPRCDCKCSNK